MAHIHTSWEPLFEKHQELLAKIDHILESSSGKPIYPPPNLRYRVFEMDLAKIRVVLLGQDPYHQPGQAMGLSFSVPPGTKVPPSLVNIFKEISANFPERGYLAKPGSGDLTRWADEEGIFLLNASLSVEEGTPASHMKLWSAFTDDVIRYIAEQNSSCIFLLLGAFAATKAELLPAPVQENRVCITSHPSPLGAHKGFLGSGIFKQVEEKLGQSVSWAI
jgi:uracil-DNA glycosylase